MRLTMLLLALAACTENPGGVDDGGTDAPFEELECDAACWPRRCAYLTYDESEPIEGLEVGSMVDGVFVPWANGGDVTYLFGFQGGAMIQPIVRVPESLAGDGCVRVELTNARDANFPDGPVGELDEFGSASFFQSFRRDGDGHVIVGPFDNQLGWGAPDGLQLELTVTARSTNWSRSTTLRVRVVDADGFDECDLVPSQGLAGCTYRVFYGNATVTSIDVAESTPCSNDRVDVHYVFAPNDASTASCIDESVTGTTGYAHTVSMSLGCIAEAGLAEGESFPIQWRLGDTPSCPPFEAWPDVTIGGCPCAD
ncbi:MAG: hypothetical protein R3B99_05150 [Polyangiales bacterium]